MGVDDNFFELGGDSLKAMVLLKKVKEQFGVGFTLKEIMTKPTVRLIAEHIDEMLWVGKDAETENSIII